MAETTPVATTANWLDPPYNRWGFRHVPDLCRPPRSAAAPGRCVRSRAPSATSRTSCSPRWSQLHARGDARGDAHGRLPRDPRRRRRHRAVPRRHARTDTHLLMSCSKSLTSILCGVLAGRGLLTTADLVTDHLPELTGTAWEGCRLQHLLDMRAGNAWDFDVDEYTILDVSDYRTHSCGPSRATRRPGSARRPWPPRHGTARSATARSPRTCSAGFARAGGAPFAELFSREVWSRIGAEQDADHARDAGFAIVEGGICTTLRDLARFGLMCLEDGRRRRSGRARRLDRARAGRATRS